MYRRQFNRVVRASRLWGLICQEATKFLKSCITIVIDARNLNCHKVHAKIRLFRPCKAENQLKYKEQKQTPFHHHQSPLDDVDSFAES